MNNSFHITFCLPSILKVPSGGFKIVFEYANRLVKLGYKVSIIFLTDGHFINYTTSLYVKKILGQFKLLGYPNWFSLDKKVNRIATPYLDGRDFPQSNAIIATSARTAEIIANLANSKGKKFYLIQGFENWGMTEERLIQTYQLGLKNIVIASWLKDIVRQKSTQDAVVISNPIDTNKFYVNKNINDRNQFEIAMLYHIDKHKGVDIAFKALDIVYQKYKNIHVNLFGVFKTDNLPEYCSYIYKATDRDLLEIYNKSAIFLCASKMEGFGLTGAESMACGCALVSTAYKGVFEYAKNGHNSLLSEIDNPQLLAENLIQLIENSGLRINLAKQGAEDIKHLSWDIAIRRFESEVCS